MYLFENKSRSNLKGMIIHSQHSLRELQILMLTIFNGNFSTCRKHLPVLSSFMTYHCVCN